MEAFTGSGGSEWGSRGRGWGIRFVNTTEPQSRGLDNWFGVEGKGEAGVKTDSKVLGLDPGRDLEDEEQARL